MKILQYIIVFLLISSSVIGQTDSLLIQNKKGKLQITAPKYNPLAPSKAAFYSAILPGAGQIYNNRYWWQLPLIYGGLGSSIYFYSVNKKDYKRYRTAYKLRKSGQPDEFDGLDGKAFISEAGLENAQKQIRKNRDVSLMMAVLTYVLQIIEASVTAHLLQFDDSDSLTLHPVTIPDSSFKQQSPDNLGIALKYSF